VQPATSPKITLYGSFMEFSDTPGTPGDPWQLPSMSGNIFRYTHMFETYIVCLRPTYAILGRFFWMYVMEVTVGANATTTSSSYPR
jgi:hypothetical protein